MDYAAIHPDRLNYLSYWAFKITLLVIKIMVVMIIFLFHCNDEYVIHKITRQRRLSESQFPAERFAAIS